MRKFLGLTLIIGLCLFKALGQNANSPNPSLIDPQDQYKELYKEVELGQIYPDSKTFADAVPKFPASQILADYEKSRKNPGFNLKQFVEEHFTRPASFQDTYKTNLSLSTADHITELWPVLTHPADKTQPDETSFSQGTLIPLPHPYIVPGGRFQEIYYWDSYFTCLGLVEDHKISMVENMISNFAYLLNTIGHIPNGNRTYYLGRSQPPFFAAMVDLLAEVQGPQVLVNYIPEMEKEYHYWMAGKERIGRRKGNAPFQTGVNLKVVELAPGVYLNRYCDESLTPRGESYREDYLAVNADFKDKTSQEKAYQNIRSCAESGIDFSSRWYNGQKDIAKLNITDLISVDLNCLLFNLEKKLAKAYYIDNDSVKGKQMDVLAENRKKAILKYCWNEKEGFFLDYNFRTRKQSPIKTLAGVYPLFFQVSTQLMADKVAKVLEKDFAKPGGLVTSLNNTGQQWDAPNGWAPLNYLGIQGLHNYGKDSLAKNLALRWLRLNDKVYKATGKMQEKYNVVDTTLVGGGGEYPNQDGFGWTNGVYKKLTSIYKN